jgi:CMP-N,N'-diacetyllegionaminic acid synthase
MTTVVLVPARSGSERVTNKNFREIQGQSLVSRAARIGLAAGLATYVSTDDPDRAVDQVPSTAQVVARPAHLAASATSMEDVVLHLASELHLNARDRVLLLQPTSPLRTIDSLKSFLAACEELDATSMSAFSATADFGDYWYASPDGANGRVRELLPGNYAARRSQERNPLLRENGLYYLCSIEFLNRTGRLVGPTSRIILSPGEEDLDIDLPCDWRRAEALLAGVVDARTE